MGVYRFEDLRVWQAAKRLCGELKAGDYAADGRKYIASHETAEFIGLNESIAKMLGRWQGTLDVGNQPARTRREGRTKDQGWTKGQGRTKN